MNIHLTLNNVKFASRMFKQTMTLTKHGVFDKVIIYGIWDKQAEEEEWLTDKICIKRLRLKTKDLPKNLFSQIFKYLELIIILIGLLKKNNCTVFTAHSIGTLPIGVILKKIFNIKLIYDAHEYETERTGLNGVRKKMAIKFERLLIKYIDSIVVVNHTIAKEYIKKYNLTDNIYVVYNCPSSNQNANQSSSSILKQLHEIPANYELFLYQGALCQGRGIEILLKVFSQQQFENKVLMFMGYGHYKDKILDYARRFENIYYQQAVAMEQIAEYTSSADVGLSLIENVSLSYYYCLPNKLFEYILNGLPVLASNFPEMQAVIKEYNVGRCISPNDEKALINILNNFDWHSIPITPSKIDDISSVFSWEKQEDKLLLAYDFIPRKQKTLAREKSL